LRLLHWSQCRHYILRLLHWSQCRHYILRLLVSILWSVEQS
jgi:hypothetical protein